MIPGSENQPGSPPSIATPLIAMRLTPPRLAEDSVRRERLLQRVCGADKPAARLCLVTAPAGYGKSTFLAQCRQQLGTMGLATAWLTLDEDDNERDQFFYYLWAAFSQLNPAISSELLESHLARGESAGGRRLVKDLLGFIVDPSRRYALFLDDYHHIDDPQVHEAMQFLLKHLPDNLHLFIGSRSLPPIPLSRLRAAGDLLQLDSGDLGFDSEETGALLRDANHLQVSGEEIALLRARTGGWAAVLQLAALSMQGAADRSRFVSAFSGDHESVSDFLAEEVVTQMPAALAEFLRRIAILERFCAPLCEAVSGDREHSLALAKLRDSRLLIQSLDESGHWFRLHPLFRNFLLRRLESAGAERVAELHRRASAWFEEEGLMAEAIQHAISAGDENRALDLLDDQGVTLIAQGYMFQFLGLVRRLPEVLLRESLAVLIQLAWLQVLSNQLPQGRRLLDELRNRIETLDRAQRVELHCIEASLHAIDDQWEKAGQLSDTWLPESPAEPVYLRPTFRLLQELVHYHRQEFARAQEVARELLSVPMVADLVYNQAFAACVAALSYLAGAKLKRGAEYLEVQLQNILRHVMPSSQLVALLESILGVLYYHRGDLQRAEMLFQRGLEAQRVIATTDMVIPVLRSRVRLLHELGDMEGAFGYLRETQALAEERGWVRLQACLAQEWVHLLLALGELPQARARFAEWRKLRDSFSGLSAHAQASVDNWTRIAEAELALAEGDAAVVEKLLEPILREYLASGNLLRAMELQLLLARARLSVNRPDAARGALAEALAVDQENSVVQLFRNEGEQVVAALLSLRQELAQSGEPERHHQLWQQQIDAIATPYRQQPAPAARREAVDLAESGLVGELTKKELATLALLVEGYSNKEISERLCVSTNTVKTHLKSAYGKLGVSRRTQAVRSLKRLGIFE